jgi:DNA-binding NarL/FixJ family response regulator
MPAYAKKMLKMGASGYVTKNSSRQELIKTILEVHEGKTYICEEVKNIIIRNELEPEAKPDINLLSKRELEIVQFIKQGLSSKEISTELSLSLKTIEVHRYNILKKLDLPNAAALVNFVNHNGI